MDREFHRRWQGIALVAWLICCPSVSIAQQPTEPADPTSATPPAASPMPEPSPLVGDPKTPEELFEAAVLMAGIVRPDLAAMYLDKLVGMELDDEALLALRDKFGAAPMLRLLNIKELKASAEKLLDRTNVVVARRASDPARALRLLQKLDGKDPDQQAAGLFELRALGERAVPGLLAVLSDPAQQAHHESVLATLVQVGPPAIPLLIGGLQSPDAEFRAQIVTVLGYLRAQQAAPYLWHQALSPSEPDAMRATARMALGRIFQVPESGVDRIASQGTIAKLTQIAGRHFRHEQAWPVDEQGRVTLWMWNADQKTVVPTPHTPGDASDITGLLLARQALSLAPDVRKVQVLYLSLALTSEIHRAGFDQPLPTGPGTAHDLALSVGPAVVLDVLSESLAASRPETAVAALRVIEQIGTRAQLAGTDGKRSPILAALDYPDPRVQFAAASAILQFDPQSDFRGATRVVEVLKRAAASNPRPHAVVGEVSAARAALIGGFLRDLGYEPLVHLSGREAFRAAASRADVELVVLHPNIIRWALSETLANLRADSRTAGIPIVVHGPGELQSRLRTQIGNYRLVSYAHGAEVTDDFESQVRPFLAQIKTPAMSDTERAGLRKDAIGWLAHIAAGRRTRIFEITGAAGVLMEALIDPQVARSALDTLAEIPTQEVQRRIAELVLDQQAPIDLRQVAALRLTFHLQRFGLLLSNESINSLHQLWKDPAQPADFRTALGGMIGSLKPDDTLVGKRLQAFPTSK
jgi:HEAT repeat protein